MRNPRLPGKIILASTLLLVFIGTLSSIVYSHFQGFISAAHKPITAAPLEMTDGNKRIDDFSRTSPSWRRKFSEHIFTHIDEELQSLEQQFILHDSAEGKRLIARVKISLQKMIFGKQKFMRTGLESSLSPFYNGRTVLEYNLWKLKNLTQDLQMDQSQSRGLYRVYALMNKWLVYVAHREINARRKGTLDASPRGTTEPTGGQSTKENSTAFPQISELAKITERDLQEAGEVLSHQPAAAQGTTPGINLETLKPETRQNPQQKLITETEQTIQPGVKQETRHNSEPNLIFKENADSPKGPEETANSAEASSSPNWMVIFGVIVIGILLATYLILRIKRKSALLSAYHSDRSENHLEQHGQNTADLVDIHTLLGPDSPEDTEGDSTEDSIFGGVSLDTSDRMSFHSEEPSQELKNTLDDFSVEELETSHEEGEGGDQQSETYHAREEELAQELESTLAGNNSLIEELETSHKEKESLEKQLATLQAEKEDQDKQLETLRTENEELAQGQENILEENNSLTEKIKTFQEEKEDRDKQLETLRAENEELTLGLDNILAENDSLTEKLESFHDKGEGGDPQLETLHAEKEALAQELENTLAENNSLTEKLETLHEETEGRNNQLETLHAEKEALAQKLENTFAENNSLTETLATSRNEKEGLEKQLETLNAREKELAQELESTLAENNSLTETLATSRNENEGLEKQLESLNAREEKLVQELESTLAEKISLAENFETSREEEEQESRVKELENALAENHSLTEKLVTTREEKESLEKQLEALNAREENLAQELESTLAENNSLTESLETFHEKESSQSQAQEQKSTDKKFEAMSETLESTREENKTLEKEQKNIHAEIKKLTKKFEAAQNKNKGLTKELKNITTEKEAVSKKLAAAQENNKTITKQNKALADQWEALQTENSQTIESEHTLTRELQALSLEAKDLKEKLESTSSENETLKKQLEITLAEMGQRTSDSKDDLTRELEAMYADVKNIKDKLESTYLEKETLAQEEPGSADTVNLSFDHDTPEHMASQDEKIENQVEPAASLSNSQTASHPDVVILQTILKAAKGFRNINKRLYKIAESRLAPSAEDSSEDLKGKDTRET